MNAADLASTAWTNLSRRKGRTALTAAGVVVGVAALVLMVSLGIGLQRQFLSLFETDESLRTLSVRREAGGAQGKRAPNPFGFGMGGQMVPVLEKDLEAMRGIPGVEAVSPELNLFLQTALEGFESSAIYPVSGLQPADEARFAKHLVQGRMWTQGERACLLPTAFLELRVHAKPEDVLGKKLSLRGLMASGEGDEEGYLCVGVIDTESFGFRGRQVYLPMDLALELREKKGAHPLLPSKKGSYLSVEVRVADPRRTDEVARALKTSGYSVLSASDVIRQINLVFLVIEAFMACIGAIGLVVSLFGIANTMAMAVLERTREIGVMKAVGARDRDVSRLFLFEAGLIGLLGGSLGTLLAWLAGKLANAVARGAFEMPDRVSLFHVPLWLAAGATGFAVAVSIVAGVLPARRAARMEPVAALRYE